MPQSGDLLVIFLRAVACVFSRQPPPSPSFPRSFSFSFSQPSSSSSSLASSFSSSRGQSDSRSMTRPRFHGAQSGPRDGLGFFFLWPVFFFVRFTPVELRLSDRVQRPPHLISGNPPLPPPIFLNPLSIDSLGPASVCGASIG